MKIFKQIAVNRESYLVELEYFYTKNNVKQMINSLVKFQRHMGTLLILVCFINQTFHVFLMDN